VDRYGIVEQVTKQMEAARLASGRGELTLQLQPAHLGSLKVTLSSAPDGVTARIVADSRVAQHALESSKDHLQTALASRGIKLSSLDVSLSGDAASNGRLPFAGSSGASGRQSFAQTGQSAGAVAATTDDSTPSDAQPDTPQPALGRVDYHA
jgi:flagellar hook-length control protein FliK